MGGLWASYRRLLDDPRQLVRAHTPPASDSGRAARHFSRSMDVERRRFAQFWQPTIAQFWQALLAMKGSFMMGLSLVLTIMPLHATAVWGATSAATGNLVSWGMLLCLVFSPIAGALADRVGRVPLAVGGSLVSALGVACMPLARDKLSYYLLRSVWATGKACLVTLSRS